MQDSRDVSRLVDRLLFESYSRGLLVPHPSYWSWPDAESVLTSINDLQDHDRLREFFGEFFSRPYLLNGHEVYIKDIKFSFPHIRSSHSTPPPDPTMTDDEIRRYIWPNGDLSKGSVGSYVSALWVDLGQEDITFTGDDDGIFGYQPTRVSNWKKILDWPIMVGSNHCNLAMMRSYLDSDDLLPTPDSHGNATYGDRARYLLDEVIKYEPYAPDGYFVVNGKMKKVNIIDRIQMNMIYVIKDARKMPFPLADVSSKGAVINDRICEVRSVMQDQGLVFHQLYFMYVSDETIPKGIDRDVYRMYNAPAIMSISSLRMAMNMFDIIRGYAIISQGLSGSEGMDTLMEEIDAMSGGDPIIMRAAHITKAGADVNDDAFITGMFRDLLQAKRDTRIGDDDAQHSLKEEMDIRVLPHCSLGGDPYVARIRYLAMMFIKLTYTVMGDMPDTDRKDFSFKRWEPVGYLLRDYLRNFFLYQRDLSKISRGEQNLLVMMNQNKWATKYTPGTRKMNQSTHKDGIVDDVTKFNTVSMIDSIRTIKISAKSSVNTAVTRKIHTSQWGAQCFANTPENANIGLNNNLAEAVLISAELTRSERDALHDIIDQEEEVSEDEGYLLMVDGCPWKMVDPSFYDTLRDHRQEGNINRGIGLAMHHIWASGTWEGVPAIVVLTSHGRPVIPMLRLDRDPINLDRIMEIPNLDDPTLESLIEDGLVELVDSYEMSYNVVVAEWLYIRDRDGDFKEIDPSLYTHCMIKPGYILSQATNTLSFLEHNPAARGTYATVHTKQSISRPFIHPEERYDHEVNYLRDPEPPLVTTDTARRLHMDEVGIGRNVKIACMPYDNNRDDAIVFSEKVVKDGILDGVHYNVFKSDHGITGQNRYNWQIQDLGGELSEIRGLIDPDFSDSVILPYGKPHIIERPLEEVQGMQMIPLRKYGQYVYQVEDGRLYTMWGIYKPVTVTYDDGSTRTIEPGKEPYDLPGKTRVSSTTEEPVARLALAYIRQDIMDAGYLGTLATEDDNLGWKDTPFITKEPLFTSKSGSWHAPVDAPIPRTLTSSTGSTVRGTLMAIYPRRAIVRTEVAVKLLERGILLEADKIVNIRKERFDITHGYIDGIDRTSGIKIRGAMPIGPKPGNKYAALYAQKNVNAGIIPEDQMPVARWTNPITGKEEEMHYDIVFNPLSFPSRMTMGMIIEILIAGTLDYLYALPYPETGGTVKDAISLDPDGVSRYMEDTYGVEDIVSLVGYLSDSTCFMYDNEEKIAKARDLREKLGIPIDGLYDVYMPDGTKVTNKIYSGTVYYVALRHLVDNKRRARGYVGKKDPMTLQPVKGRRRNGGANTGVQETDAYKAHSAAALLHERMATTSDAETLFKCPDCGGLATRLSREEYRCIDCGTVIPADKVIMHNTVWSWHLFRNYLRSISVDMTEHFQ